MNKREIGTKYEQIAGQYMESCGFEICERNFQCRQGEIDMIGFDGEYLVFTEVKYREDNRKGSPEEAVTLNKQRKICRTADYYRMLHGYSDDRPIRYDVIAISGSESQLKLKWYKNAFSHSYKGHA